MEIIDKIKNKFYSRSQYERRLIIMSGVFFLVCTALGSLFHFGFDLFGGLKWLAPFVPVNESVWEHLKLSFIPYVLILLPIEYLIYGKHTRWFIPAKLIGVYSAMIFIVMEFYTIKGAVGEPSAAVNIILYCIGTLISYLIPAVIGIRSVTDSPKRIKALALIALALTLIIFFVFTYCPPHLPIFLDPMGTGYGYYMIR